MKILMMLCCIVFGFDGAIMRCERLTDSFNYVSSIVIISDGNKLNMQKGDDKYQVIIDELNKSTVYCHEMPGFGIDGDKIESQDKNKGLWIELCFDTCFTYNGFDFDSLLFNIQSDSFDLNIMRRVNGKLAGQCFYLSLDNSLKNLYETIEEIIN